MANKLFTRAATVAVDVFDERDVINPPYKYSSAEMIATSADAILLSNQLSNAVRFAELFWCGSSPGAGASTVYGVARARFKNASYVVNRSSSGMYKIFVAVAHEAISNSLVNMFQLKLGRRMIVFL